MSGVELTGFYPKTLLQIKAGLETEINGIDGIDGVLTFQPETLMGQLSAILSDRLSELWEVAEAIYHSSDPDDAQGAALDSVAQLTGTIREQAQPSTAVCACTGDVGTLLSVGRLVDTGTNGAGVQFISVEEKTITALPDWQDNTAYPLGYRVTNVSKAYECIIAGTSELGGDGPTLEADQHLFLDGTARWRWLGNGEGAVDVAFESIIEGPVVAIAFSIKYIDTPISGWLGVLNMNDAKIGKNIELDSELRTRRFLELSLAGSATVDGIRADVLASDSDIDECFVFENDTDVVVDGMQPHSVEVLVRGGDDDAIRRAVFDTVAAGIYTNGDNEGIVTDLSGNPHTIRFNRPEEIDIYVKATITKDPSTFPSDGSDLVKAAMAVSQTIGRDAVSSVVASRVFIAAIPGVLDVSPCYIGLATNPSSEATIVIGNRQQAVFDTSRVQLILQDGAP